MPITVSFEQANGALYDLELLFHNGAGERTMRYMEQGIIELAEAVKKQAKGRGGLTRWPQHAVDEITTSLPGTPPARVTGELLNSIRVVRGGRTGPYSFSARVGSTTFYANVLEYGGKWTIDDSKPGFWLPKLRKVNSWNINPRPFMGPAYNRVMGGRSGAGVRIIHKNVRRAMNVMFHPYDFGAASEANFFD